MTVEELIEQLKECPPTWEPMIWDHESDEYVPVMQASWDGHQVTLSPVVESDLGP